MHQNISNKQTLCFYDFKGKWRTSRKKSKHEDKMKQWWKNEGMKEWRNERMKEWKHERRKERINDWNEWNECMNSPGPCGLGRVRSPAWRKEGLRIKERRNEPPFIPPAWTSGEGICRAKPCQASSCEVKKHYKTCVILRIWLPLIDPIAPAHATCAYKTTEISTFWRYGI